MNECLTNLKSVCKFRRANSNRWILWVSFNDGVFIIRALKTILTLKFKISCLNNNSRGIYYTMDRLLWNIQVQIFLNWAARNCWIRSSCHNSAFIPWFQLRFRSTTFLSPIRFRVFQKIVDHNMASWNLRCNCLFVIPVDWYAMIWPFFCSERLLPRGIWK